MEKNVSFDAGEVKELVCRLAWAQLEIFSDDVPQIQVLAAGDERTVGELRIELHDGRLVVEQPQYGFSFNFTGEKWMEVCVRIPKGWRQSVDAHTISGLLNARGVEGTDLTLDTISGDLRAMGLRASGMGLHSVSGDIKAGDLRGERLMLRTVSGDVSLQSVAFEQVKVNSVSGDNWLEFRAPFARLDASTVSGDVQIRVPADTLDVSMRSVSGRVRMSGIYQKEGASAVRCNGVSADLEVISTLKREEKA